jgi:N-acetylmuramoyl-L-alanine amidase
MRNFDHGHPFNHGFDHRFDDHHGFDHRFVDRDHFHRDRFFFIFDFPAFGYPWWYPDYYYGYPYQYWYPYPYYTYYGPSYDPQYWTNLAVSVQSALAQRGYYHGPADGNIGPDSREAIRSFQAAQKLPATGIIDPKLLKALGIRYRTA